MDLRACVHYPHFWRAAIALPVFVLSGCDIGPVGPKISPCVVWGSCPSQGASSETVATSDLGMDIQFVHAEADERISLRVFLHDSRDRNGYKKGRSVYFSESDNLTIIDVSNGEATAEPVEISYNYSSVFLPLTQVPVRYKIELRRDNEQQDALETYISVPGVISTLSPPDNTEYNLEDVVPFTWLVVDSSGNEVGLARPDGVGVGVRCDGHYEFVDISFASLGEDAIQQRRSDVPISRMLSRASINNLPCEMSARIQYYPESPGYQARYSKSASIVLRVNHRSQLCQLTDRRCV